jgi:hypothetical protein
MESIKKCILIKIVGQHQLDVGWKTWIDIHKLASQKMMLDPFTMLNVQIMKPN